MNREIRFRVWSEEHACFFYSDLCLEDLRAEGMYGWAIHRNEYNDGSQMARIVNVEVDTQTAQQFTGLIDTQGREVYEGDIVQFDICGHAHGPDREKNCGGVVWYNDKEAMFCFGKYISPEWTSMTGHVRPAYEWWYSAADDIDWKTFKVIGNIYQNSEPLAQATPKSGAA